MNRFDLMMSVADPAGRNSDIVLTAWILGMLTAIAALAAIGLAAWLLRDRRRWRDLLDKKESDYLILEASEDSDSPPDF